MVWENCFFVHENEVPDINSEKALVFAAYPPQAPMQAFGALASEVI